MDSKSYQLNRLTDEQQQNPLELLKDFFTRYTLQELREALEDYASLAVSEEDTQTHYRPNTLFLTKRLEEVLEATYLLQLKKKQG